MKQVAIITRADESRNPGRQTVAGRVSRVYIAERRSLEMKLDQEMYTPLPLLRPVHSGLARACDC